jgi:tetratricopeptide (TPR) repeat protein
MLYIVEQIFILIVGCLIGGLLSYFISNHFSSARSDFRRARYLLKKNKHDEALEHYNRFFLETRNTSLLWNEIKYIFYAECEDVFIYPVGSPEAAIIAFLYNKKADNKIIAPILFSLISLHKELSQSDRTWVFEIPSLLINNQKKSAFELLKKIEESTNDFPEWRRHFYFELLVKALDSSDVNQKSRA